ncbi:MAG: sigma-70 family RNA polymerase sigma factor, partial [Hyphomicrobiaceae bacterium]
LHVDNPQRREPPTRGESAAIEMNDSANSSDHGSREDTWRGLMRAAQEGDSQAYSRLLTELLPLLRGVVRRKWRNRQDVEDIVQDILFSLHAVRHTYDPKRPFLPWVMTIVSRRIADAARRVRRRTALETTVAAMPETFAGDVTKTEQESSDDREAIGHAMAALPVGQRQAVELLKVQGLTLHEAAAVTGKSAASLKVAVHRALKAMRRMFKTRT